MFNALTKGFRAARQRLTGMAELTDDVVDQALRDVRVSLLEADVELGVVKRFLARVREKVLGQVVQVQANVQGQRRAISPEQVFVKACEDELIAMMSDGDNAASALREAPKGTPTVVMMVGLQGQGKTTTSAKLAKLYAAEGKKVLLVAADLQRPAAVEQLTVLGQKVNVPVFSVPGSTPVEVCRRALAVAKVQKKDLVILDTAGRLAIDTTLMQELEAIKAETKPQNILLVVNAAIGQNALSTAQTFHETLGLTGVALTMLDGDARGGAALSIREVTGVPIKFAGVGEGVDQLEPFRPDGMASRILGMGDIVGIVNDFNRVVTDQKKVEEDAQRMLQGQFTFDDFVSQIDMIKQMGPLQELFEKMPFFAEMMPPDVKVDDTELDKVKVMIASMTKAERNDAELFRREGNRIQRVAKGSGRKPEEVAELITKFMMMRDMMGGIGQQAGVLSRLPGAKQLAMARRLREAVRVQGDNAAFSNLMQEMLEAAVAGGGPGAGGAMGDPMGFMNNLLGGGAPGKGNPGGMRQRDMRRQQRLAKKKGRK
ncbi:MAG: signal recognition particle protein [Polyangiales bacterium]